MPINDYQDDFFTVPEPAGVVPPGIYLVSVSDIEKRKSKDNSPQLRIDLTEIETGNFVASDFLTFGAKSIGMSLQKLKQFGIVIKSGEQIRLGQIAEDLGMRRAYAAIATGKEYRGVMQMQVDIGQGNCGYWPDDGPPPEGYVKSAAPVREAPMTASGEEPDTTPF